MGNGGGGKRRGRETQKGKAGERSRRQGGVARPANRAAAAPVGSQVLRAARPGSELVLAQASRP